jgi:hypothetical protein
VDWAGRRQIVDRMLLDVGNFDVRKLAIGELYV